MRADIEIKMNKKGFAGSNVPPTPLGTLHTLDTLPLSYVILLTPFGDALRIVKPLELYIESYCIVAPVKKKNSKEIGCDVCKIIVIRRPLYKISYIDFPIELVGRLVDVGLYVTVKICAVLYACILVGWMDPVCGGSYTVFLLSKGIT